jgi:hypothetical protein
LKELSERLNTLSGKIKNLSKWKTKIEKY